MNLKKLLRLRPPPPPREHWEERYRRGYAGNPHDLAEMGHFAVVAGYLRLAGQPHPRIVDAGCGRGQLLDQLGADSLGSYDAFDLSETAIADARARATRLGLDPSRIVVASFDDWPLPAELDAVVFCESLTYAPDPVGTLQRFLRVLSPEGVGIVSLYRNQQAKAIGRKVERAFQLLDHTAVIHHSGKRWDVRLLRPLRR